MWGRLTWGALAPQELPLALPLAPGAVGGLPAAALSVRVVEAARVDVARALPRGQQVPGSLALVDPELARRVLQALPLLQKPRGSHDTRAQSSLIAANADANQIPGNQNCLGDTRANHGHTNPHQPD